MDVTSKSWHTMYMRVANCYFYTREHHIVTQCALQCYVPFTERFSKTIKYCNYPRGEMDSIACSSEQAPGCMTQKLQKLFGQKNLQVRSIMPSIADCITEAESTKDLQIVRHVMCDYKSSNIGPTRKRAMALEGGSVFVGSSRDGSGGVPKAVDKLLAEKEQELQAGPQIGDALSDSSGRSVLGGVQTTEPAAKRSISSDDVSASQAIAETGIAPLHENLVQLFKRPKLSCKEVTQELASRIIDAKYVGELNLIWHVMRDFQSNNIGPTRKRVLALGDAAEVETDLAQLTDSMRQNAGVPKKIRSMLESKEAQLQHGSESSSRHTPPTPRPARQRSAAKSNRAAGEPLPEQGGSVNPELTECLAKAFGVDPETVHKMRRRDALFSLVDITRMVTGNDPKYSSEQIVIVRAKYPEVSNKIRYLKFPGRGQRETPVGDLYLVAEFVMLLPGKRAALVRSEAARLFVQYHGGESK